MGMSGGVEGLDVLRQILDGTKDQQLSFPLKNEKTRFTSSKGAKWQDAYKMA